jgi:ubiquitin-conjugating enzyme E2 variant
VTARATTHALPASQQVTWGARFELAATVACAFLLLMIATRVVPLVADPAAWPGLVAVAALAWLAADLVSGLVHWLCDTFFAEDTPFVGRAVIEPFREHHRDPLAITRRGFTGVNGANCAVVLPVLALAAWGEPSPRHVFVLAFGFGVCLTNQFHKWAHAPRVPRAAVWLQRAGLIVPPAHHARHHRHGTSAFCVASGWCNPLLDRTAVFARLERAIRRG